MKFILYKWDAARTNEFHTIFGNICGKIFVSERDSAKKRRHSKIDWSVKLFKWFARRFQIRGHNTHDVSRLFFSGIY